MDGETQLDDVVAAEKDVKSSFSLLKGLFVLGVGMFVGFFLAYELVNTSGDVMYFDDVIDRGLLETSDGGQKIAKREDDLTEIENVTSLPEVASLMTSTDSGDNSIANPTLGSNTSSIWDFNETSVANLTNNTDIAIANGTNVFNNISFIYNLTTTTTMPIAPCFQSDYQLCNACEITSFINATYGNDVTLENIGHMIFKVELIDRLLDKCKDGEWCLSDDWLLISDNNEYLDFCYAGSCLRDNMPDECLDKKRRLIVSTLIMLCDAVNGTDNITDQCFMSLRKMSHVTMAKLNAEQGRWENCEPTENCSNTCHQLARGLYCMDAICDHKKDMYKEYSEWHWYFETDDVICQVDNNTICNFLFSPAENWYDTVWRNLKKIDVTDMADARVLSVVIVAGMVMIVGVVGSVLACAKKGPILKRYSRDRVEYTPVSDDDDEVFDTA